MELQQPLTSLHLLLPNVYKSNNRVNLQLYALKIHYETKKINPRKIHKKEMWRGWKIEKKISDYINDDDDSPVLQLSLTEI